MTFIQNRLRTRKSKLVAGASVLLLVAACGGGSGVVTGIDTLGAIFANAFNTAPNGDALVDVASANLQVDPTIDPFNP